jgi:hypothetical protein
MPYSITTKDGITIDNIPDNVPPDSPELKARVAAIRAGGGAAALEAPQAQAPSAPPAQPTSAMDVAKQVGAELTAPIQTGLTLGSGLLAQIPAGLWGIIEGVRTRDPERASQAVQELQQLLTIAPQSKTAQAALEGVGKVGEVLAIPGQVIGGAVNELGSPLLATGAQIGTDIISGGALGKVATAGKQAVQAGRAAAAARRAMPAEVPPPQVSIIRPPAEELAQRMQAQAARAEAAGTAQQAPMMAAPAAGAAAPLAAAATETEGAIDVLNLARKAQGFGPGSSAAKAKLADMAQVNPEARAAAERLGVDLPVDVFSDSPQVRAAVGLTRAKVGGEAEAAWEATVRQFMQKADEISQQSDAAFIEGRPAPGMTSQRILDSLTSTRNNLQTEAKDLYTQVNKVVPKSFPASTDNLAAEIAKIKNELGTSAEGIKSLQKLDDMVNSGMTYGGVSFEKSMLGAAKRAGTTNEYAKNLNLGTIKRLEGALAKDQLDTVEAFGGNEVRRQLRAANLLTTKQSALEKRIVGAFGKEIDGSVAQKMQTAIATASKGDAAAFNKLMKVVPQELQKETVSTALASITAGKATGRAIGAAETVFSPSEYTKVYRGLRANPPVYAQMVKIMGPEWDRTARDLYEVSRRVADAQARIPTTGKANQILGEAAVDGLIGNVMANGIAQRVTTGAAGLIPGGAVIAPDIVQFMAGAKGSGVQKASKLFASPEFQELAVKAATTAGQPSRQVVRRAAMSAAFSEFANAVKMPKSLDYRIAWLQNSMQATAQAAEPQVQP